MLKSTEVQDHILWQAVPVLAICCQFGMHYEHYFSVVFTLVLFMSPNVYIFSLVFFLKKKRLFEDLFY